MTSAPRDESRLYGPDMPCISVHWLEAGVLGPFLSLKILLLDGPVNN